MPEKERKLGIWGKYLTLWVALCIAAGIGLGRLFPGLSDVLAELEVEVRDPDQKTETEREATRQARGGSHSDEDQAEAQQKNEKPTTARNYGYNTMEILA